MNGAAQAPMLERCRRGDDIRIFRIIREVDQ